MENNRHLSTGEFSIQDLAYLELVKTYKVCALGEFIDRIRLIGIKRILRA